MQITFENGTLHSISKKTGPSDGADKRPSDFETWWALDKSVGTGTWGKIELRPGFDLYIADFRVKESLSSYIESPRPGFAFGFWISGKTFGSGEHIPPLLYDKQGSAPILYSPDQYNVSREEKNSCRRSVVLVIEPDPLHLLLRGTLDTLPQDFRRFLDGETPGISSSNGRITATISRVLETLFRCPLEGATRRLFIESKAMELIALRLDQTADLENSNRKSHELRPDDVERIRFAAKQLCLDLVNPPSLFELSVSVGISHAKLTNGFKQVFGTTPFGYLRQMRLDQASILLKTRRMSVTESAFAVGYNSLSSFARAFRNQYGCNPGKYIVNKCRS